MSADEFFRQRAVELVISGRYSLANWFDPQGNRREFACRATRISPFRMMISAPVVGKVGSRVSAYFRDFGEFEGTISDTTAGGFLFELELDGPRRERLADKLRWLEQKQRNPSVRDARENPRIIPQNPHSVLTFADGSQHSCFVIDVSTSGAAVSADVFPEIGTPLAIGSSVGRVVRIFREGFAVKFAEVLDAERFEQLVMRAPVQRKYGNQKLAMA